MATTESEKIQKNNYTYTYTERQGKRDEEERGEREMMSKSSECVKTLLGESI